MTATATQAELALARAVQPVSVPVEVIRAQRTRAAAFTLACTASGLDDKEVYLSCGIDAGHFCRIKKGEAEFPSDKLSRFCDTVHNTIYPEWIAYQVGCTLVQIKSETERQLEAERQRSALLEVKVRVLQEAINGRVTA